MGVVAPGEEPKEPPSHGEHDKEGVPVPVALYVPGANGAGGNVGVLRDDPEDVRTVERTLVADGGMEFVASVQLLGEDEPTGLESPIGQSVALAEPRGQ